MIASVQKMLWVTLVFGVALTVVRAEDEDEDDSEAKARGVSVKTIFPEQMQNTQLTAGEETKALINFENGAESTYQVEFVKAHLASALQAGHIVQNLTGMLVNRTVNQGESVSMLYKFTPFKDMDPRDYNLVLQVYFMSEDDNDRMARTAYNETIMVNDGASAFDIQSLFLTVLLVGAAGFFYNNYKAKTVVTSKRTAVSAAPTADSEVGTSTGDVDYSYITKQHAKATRNRSQEGRSKSPKSKK